MSMAQETAIRIPVDPANPGQFFACCGLLEFADRLWKGTEGWFEIRHFCIRTTEPTASLAQLLKSARDIALANDGATDREDEGENEDDAEDKSSSMSIVSPVSLHLDWWKDKSLKPWAGSMNARKIFVAMCAAIDPQSDNPLNHGQFVYDPAATVILKNGKTKAKKGEPREPFYFDGRRGANSQSLDIGFAPDPLKKLLKFKTIAYPVVEAMALIGLQRCQPKPAETPRVFDYFSWQEPYPVSVLSAAVYGILDNSCGYRFENAFRTPQRKHKAFNPATPIERSK
ncbi:MAG: type I-U CRISPR-associated protein Cas8c [Deltaproteobacteria bacterium]|nr:type I-U CRISPR-associated protein Cas8c [Deltaproteobacteria bacterium]